MDSKQRPSVRPGNFQGPKNSKGGRSQCQWVPPSSDGGPPGSDGYWKTNDPGKKGWNRYDQEGNPISPEQAHPGSKIPEPTAAPNPQPENESGDNVAKAAAGATAATIFYWVISRP